MAKPPATAPPKKQNNGCTAIKTEQNQLHAKGRLKTQIQGFQTTFHLSPVSTPQILLKYRLI